MGKMAGKIGKPQKKKNKKTKIKKYGVYKNNNTVNMAPKSLEQEIPRSLRDLGIAIKEVQQGKTRNRNKFKNGPDGPNPKNAGLSKKDLKDLKVGKLLLAGQETGNKKMGKKMGKKMTKMTQEATDSYIRDLKPSRPLLENFRFKQGKSESDQQFLNRVEAETRFVINKSKIDDQFDVKDEDKIKSLVKAKISAEKREKKKKKMMELEPPADFQELKNNNEPVLDFDSFQDKVAFGEVAHAPPVLSVLPKKAMKSKGHDRPGERIPELKEAFDKKITSQPRKIGTTVKRKKMTSHQQIQSDAKRTSFIEAYRQMKKKRKLD